MCDPGLVVREEKKILDALFPRYLPSPEACPKPKREWVTGVEVDRAEAESYAAGNFVPKIVRRETFGDRQAQLGLGVEYEVEIANCVPNMFRHVVVARFFDEELAVAHPKPVFRDERHPSSPRPACPDGGS